jgi:hypothetical protein
LKRKEIRVEEERFEEERTEEERTEELKIKRGTEAMQSSTQ